MAYFTAVLFPGPGPRDWRSLAVDVEAGSVDELADALRAAVEEEDPDAAAGPGVLAVLERDDEWFALVRVDSDVRVFVSDAVTAADSAFEGAFAELPTAADLARPAAAEEPRDDGTSEAASAAGAARAGVVEETWAGDPGLLADLGCPAELLVDLAVAGTDPAEATVRVGERVGFADALEALR